ncbi:MAG: hypothetical protein AAGA80_21020 [Cyanobacteria bacterium P01_F01_bin.143]
MDWRIAATVITSVFLAFAGYIATYLNNLRLLRHKEQLNRVNRQLREFYGPLFAIRQVSSVAWRAFRSLYRPGKPFWNKESQPTEEEAAAWRLWMSEVFMPLNTRIMEIIIENADLLDEKEFPECLLQLSAHVTSYKPVLKAWESGDYSIHVSVINFPLELDNYVNSKYQELKRRQEQLIGKVKV